VIKKGIDQNDSGINVAVISSSFDTLGDAKVDVLAGHLPGEG